METTATRFDRRASTYETSDLQVLNFAGGVAASQKGSYLRRRPAQRKRARRALRGSLSAPLAVVRAGALPPFQDVLYRLGPRGSVIVDRAGDEA